RTEAGVAAPGEDEFARAPHPDQLVVDDVRRHPHQRELALLLADHLVARGVRDQVRESFERDGVAVADELADGLRERDDQNGNGCEPLEIVTQRSSVNSSTTACPPKRPQPESLTPPNGICGSSPTGWSLTWTIPASICCASAKPRSVSLVMIPALRPYAVALASAIASSALSASSIAATGPNVSTFASSESSGTSASSVAS